VATLVALSLPVQSLFSYRKTCVLTGIETNNPFRMLCEFITTANSGLDAFAPGRSMPFWQQFSLWLCRIAKSGRKNPDLAIRVKHKEENSFIFRIAKDFLRKFEAQPRLHHSLSDSF
jgi:hypothetical protein